MKPKPLRVDELTALDLLVMEALTQSTRSVTTVTLAATVWNPASPYAMGADPVGLVDYIVRELGERGLLIYSYTKRQQGVNDPYAGLPVSIRLTQDGWALMGFPVRHLEAGSRIAQTARLDPMGDRTNYRKHATVAAGVGPIETDTFAEHRWKFPTHTHMYGDDDMASLASNARTDLAPVDDGEGKRGYIRVTPELEAKVMALRSAYPTHSYADLSDMAGVPPGTIKYILTDLPRKRAQNDADPVRGSLKERIVWTLDAIEGGMKNVRELRMVLGRADTEHDIVHVLHSLHTEGKVDFKEQGPDKTPVSIKLTARGRGQGLPKAKVEDHGPAPDPEEPAGSAKWRGTAPEPEPERVRNLTFPLLDALIEREGKRLMADNTAMAYLAAAEAVKDVDPDTYAYLTRKAEQSDIPFPSPIEAEYLAYVRAHPALHINENGVDMDAPLPLVSRE
jgi:hypothetical protein